MKAKKILVSIMTATMLTTMSGFSAFAEETTPKLTMIIDEDMDTSEYLRARGTESIEGSSSFVEFGEAIGNDTTLNEKLYGKALYVKATNDTATNKAYAYKFQPSETAQVYARCNSSNTTTKFVETSFDLAMYGSDKRNVNAILSNGTDYNKNQLVYIDWNNGKLTAYHGSTAVQIGTYDKNDRSFHNYKIVMKMVRDTSANTTTTTLEAVYQDGVKLTSMKDGYDFPLTQKSTGSIEKYDCLTFLINHNNNAGVEMGYYVDNVSVVRYESETENSPVADFDVLGAEVKSACTILDDTENYSEDDLAVFETELDEVIKVYKKINATQEDVNEALNKFRLAKENLHTLMVNDIYNEDFNDSTLVENLTTSGEYTIGDYDGDSQSGLYGNAAKVIVSANNKRSMSVNTTNDALKNNVTATNSAAIGTFSFDFKPIGLFEDISMPITVGSEKDTNNLLKLNFNSNGTLKVSTQIRVSGANTSATYPGNATTPISDEIKIAEGIDYSKMHNVTVVYGYTGRSESVSALKTDILGIYLDGIKLDAIGESIQSIYPLGMPQSRINRVNLTISNREEQYGQYGYWVDNVVAGLYAGGVQPVMKQNLKAAITEADYVYATLSDEKKTVVAAELDTAKAFYQNVTAGQKVCDDEAEKLREMLLPSLEEYIESIVVPSTISQSSIILPSFEGVTATLSSNNEDIISNAGIVTQPTEEAVEVTFTITLKRGESSAQKSYTVTVLPRLAVEINSAEFVDSNENVVYGPTNGGKLNKITLKVNETTDAKLFVAVYEMQRLEYCTVCEVVDGDIDLDIDVNEDSVIKFFVWDEETIKPLQCEKEITKKNPTIHIVADSIYADYSIDAYSKYAPDYGIGQAFSAIFENTDVIVNNKAIPGSTTTGWYEGYHISGVLSQIEQGDYVLISLCHNDQKIMGLDEYKANLVKVAEDVKEQGGIPVLVTAIPRYSWKDGSLNITHGEFVDAMISVGTENAIPVIDLNEHLRNLYTADGTNETTYEGYYSQAEGEELDRTHLSRDGAFYCANWIYDQFISMGFSFVSE